MQFEVRKDNSPEKLLQLNKLLQMLPKKLDLRSSQRARERGLLAANTDGSANAAAVAPPEAEITPKETRAWAATVFALTRIKWLLAAEDTVRAMVGDADMGRVLGEVAAEHASPLAQTHLQFARQAATALRDGLGDREVARQLKKLHMTKHHNAMFYCSTTEIVYGEIHETNFKPVRDEVAAQLETTVKFLAADLLPQVLQSETGRTLVTHVRKMEEKEGLGVTTCAYGVSTEVSDEQYWLDMFSVVANMLEDVGVVVSDMRIPGIPLVSINEPGFRNQTGFGQEQIGKKCTFIQCPETEDYLVEEICDALRECKSLYVKLTNRKKDGENFQCYLTLHPVFGATGEYVYQVGCQVDMNGRPEDVEVSMKKLELLLRWLPSSVMCRTDMDERRGITTLTASGDASVAALPPPVALKAAPKAKAVVTKTATGKDRDMYGKKLGKTHASAMLKLNKSAWLTDADRSLRTLLDRDDGCEAFKAFLATEYNEASLDFYLAAQRLHDLAPDEQSDEAQRLMDMYMGTKSSSKGSRGIGQQDRTQATSKLWERAKSDRVRTKDDPVAAVLNEAENTFNMLAVDSFPRFVKSKQARSLGSISGSNLAEITDAEEWLSAFTNIAETWPACIVVSDMTIPGAPMVYVNPEFCRVTEYAKAEAVGRNCRFLQGPDTEAESIGVIQRTLGKGEDCHVLLTNYRKSGEKFKNLLSMRPVFDSDDVYRYVIGVQFEVVDDGTLPMRLGQLDKLRAAEQDGADAALVQRCHLVLPRLPHGHSCRASPMRFGRFDQRLGRRAVLRWHSPRPWLSLESSTGRGRA